MHGGDRITKVTQEPQQRLNGQRSQWGGGCDEGTAVAPSGGTELTHGTRSSSDV